MSNDWVTVCESFRERKHSVCFSCTWLESGCREVSEVGVEESVRHSSSTASDDAEIDDDADDEDDIIVDADTADDDKIDVDVTIEACTALLLTFLPMTLPLVLLPCPATM